LVRYSDCIVLAKVSRVEEIARSDAEIPPMRDLVEPSNARDSRPFFRALLDRSR
jgi:hypothetical protein